MFDFKLRLDDACGPYSDPQHVRLRGHVVGRHDPGHVVEKTTESKKKKQSINEFKGSILYLKLFINASV